jgi:hypothetical protein
LNRLVRLHPCIGSPRVSARAIQENREIAEENRAILQALERRAAGQGLRKARITRAAVTQLLGSICQELVETELVPDRPAGQPTVFLREARREAAKLYRASVIRSMVCSRSLYRQPTLFTAGRRPVSYVFWDRSPGEALDLALDTIWEKCRIGAAFNLEIHAAIPYFYAENSMAIELCRPGFSVLEGWRPGDLRYCPIADSEDDDPGPDADHGLAAA